MKISVCMASYNGSKYIKKQIVSILSQLQDDDELVIVDDCSKDGTLEIIQSFNDTRILLLKNDSNQGIIKTFEKSLRNAKGELIFLSDQDDVWSPNKVSIIIDVFTQNPDITLIQHNAKMIDGQDKLIDKSQVKSKNLVFNKGVLRNIMKNTYTGCTIAFKQEMLSYCLPFPNDIPMHDMWIGILNEIYGKNLYIEEKLIERRIHDKNFTPGLSPMSKGSTFVQKTKWRWSLIKNLFVVFLLNRYRRTE